MPRDHYADLTEEINTVRRVHLADDVLRIAIAAAMALLLVVWG